MKICKENSINLNILFGFLLFNEFFVYICKIKVWWFT